MSDTHIEPKVRERKTPRKPRPKMVIKKEAKTEELSPLERARQLREELAQVEQGARQQALEAAQKAVEELNQWGVTYELRERQLPATIRNLTGGSDGSRKGTRQPNPNRPCPTCGFITNPPHDARAHKKHPAPFTAEELTARGMQKVS